MSPWSAVIARHRRRVLPHEPKWEADAASDAKLAKLVVLKYPWGPLAPSEHMVPRLIEEFLDGTMADQLVGVSRALHAQFAEYMRLCKDKDPKVNLAKRLKWT